MARIEDLGARRAQRVETTVEQIVEVLTELGGAAHRDLIAARLTAWRHPGMVKPPERLLRDIDQALRAREDDGAGRDDALFRRVFGPQSNRWTLRPRTAPTVLPLLRTRRAQPAPEARR